MSCLLPRGRAGRPKDPAKRDAILAAAVQLFTHHSFGMVTMEAVAAQAGVSKMTVYSHFADKETLFESIVKSISDRMIATLSNTYEQDAPLYDRLATTGVAFLSIMFGPEVAGLSQMLPTALRGNPKLAVRFHDAGPGRVKPALAAMIAEAAARGEVSIDDPGLAASDLVSLWEGGLRGEIECGMAVPISPEEITRRVRRGTQVFLRAYAPQQPTV